MSVDKSENQIPEYWYDGFDTTKVNDRVVFTSFWQLPFSRKLLYLGLFGCCLLLKPLLLISRLLGIKLIPSLCDGLPTPPVRVPLEAYGPSKAEVIQSGRDGQHYLSADEIQRFNRDGVIGPFRAVSKEEATELLNSMQPGWSDEKSRKQFDAMTGKGKALHEEFPELAELWKRPEVACKVASLLGENPHVWRSQFFQIRPGRLGTFWHQATLFREHNNQPAVIPPPGKQDNIAQLTVWCALTPAKRENACMKFLKGSQEIQAGIGFGNNVRYKPLRLAATVARRDLRFINDYLLGVLGQQTIAASFFPIIMPVYDEFLKVYAKYFTERCEPLTMELEPGEFVIFTSATMHGSWSNTSDHPRVSCAARVAGTGTTIHDDYARSKFPLFEQVPAESCEEGTLRDEADGSVEECATEFVS